MRWLIRRQVAVSTVRRLFLPDFRGALRFMRKVGLARLAVSSRSRRHTLNAFRLPSHELLRATHHMTVRIIRLAHLRRRQLPLAAI